MNTETYGPGGYIAEHPSGNVIERVIDNGDGTGTRTTYDEHGNETATVNLTGLPIPDLPADPDLIPPDTTQLRSPR
jgi:hypothetical protein